MVSTTLYVKLRGRLGTKDALRRLLDDLLDRMRAEPALIDFTMHEVPQEPDSFVLYENWADSDEYIRIRDRPYRLEYVRQRDPLLLSPPEVQYLTLVRKEEGSKPRPQENGTKGPSTGSRIRPVEPPFGNEEEEVLGTLMHPVSVRGQALYKAFSDQPPTAFFRTLVINPRLARTFQVVREWMHGWASIPARERELIALRTCALCGWHNEWGVRIAIYGEKVGLTKQEISATATETLTKQAWNEGDFALLTLAEQLHEAGKVDDATWSVLRTRWNDAQLLELLFIVGWYHTLAFLGNGAQVETESWAVPYPTVFD